MTEMKRKYGVFTGVSTCVGLVIGSTSFFSISQGAGTGGSMVLLLLLPVSVFYWLTANSLASVNEMMPEANGIMSAYLKPVFGPAVSLMLNLMVYLISPVFLGVMEVSLCSSILHRLFLPSVPMPVLNILFMVLLTLVDLGGTDAFARLQNIVFTVMMVTLFGFALLGFFRLTPGYLTGPEAALPALRSADTGMIMTTLSYTAFLYVGIDMVIPLEKDMKNPRRDIRLALFSGILILLVLYLLLAKGLMNYIPLAELLNDSAPNITYAEKLLGTRGSLWMGIAIIFAAVSTVNTGNHSGAEVIAGTAEEGMLPAFFAKRNRKGAPSVVLLFYGISIPAVCFLTDYLPVSTFMFLGTCCYVLVYMFIACTVIVVKIRQEKMPFRKCVPDLIVVSGCLFLLYTMMESLSLVIIFFATMIGMYAFSRFWCYNVMGLKRLSL